MQWRHLRPSHVCGAAITHQGALALRVGGELLFHLNVCAGEVLVAAHVKLQAEVTGGGEGAKFALKRLTPVLVLMHLGNEDRYTCQTNSSSSSISLQDAKRKERTLCFISVTLYLTVGFFYKQWLL